MADAISSSDHKRLRPLQAPSLQPLKGVDQIVILEIMSGKKALDTSIPSMILIADWAWMVMKSGNVEEVFEESIRNEGPKGVMERFVRVGILCSPVIVAFRPTISEALKMLEGDTDVPRLTDRPLPLSHESFRSSLGICSFME